MILTFKYVLRPTPSQTRCLRHLLEDQRILYNAALQERIDCYAKTGKTRTKFDQFKSLSEWRQSDSDARMVPSNLQRWTIGRVNDAFNAFFRRLKARNGKAGFPRFRSRTHWKSFGFCEFSGIRFENGCLHFKGMHYGLRLHLHRPLPDGKITGCQFTKNGPEWSICIQVQIETPDQRPIQSVVGLDAGITSLAALSTGHLVLNIRPTKASEKELRQKQRAMTRCRRGSRRRDKLKAAVTRLHCRIANTRNTYMHQVSADLVQRYDLIAVEDLDIQGLAQTNLAKSVHDAAWGILGHHLSYKAVRAGARIIKVDPRYTSQTCSGCGVVVPKKLSERMHVCLDCGLETDRDVNAARNILHKAVVGLEIANVIREDVRRSGQLVSS